MVDLQLHVIIFLSNVGVNKMQLHESDVRVPTDFAKIISMTFPQQFFDSMTVSAQILHPQRFLKRSENSDFPNHD